jgi:hypothetical protein
MVGRTAHTNPARGAAVNVLISTLPGSDLHRLCAEMYLCHRDAGTGACGQCGHRVPCSARRHAASVIMAAGEDPRWYDAQASPDAGHRSDQATRNGGMPANVEGFHVGGQGGRPDVPYLEYER